MRESSLPRPTRGLRGQALSWQALANESSLTSSQGRLSRKSRTSPSPKRQPLAFAEGARGSPVSTASGLPPSALADIQQRCTLADAPSIEATAETSAGSMRTAAFAAYTAPPPPLQRSSRGEKETKSYRTSGRRRSFLELRKETVLGRFRIPANFTAHGPRSSRHSRDRVHRRANFPRGRLACEGRR